MHEEGLHSKGLLPHGSKVEWFMPHVDVVGLVLSLSLSLSTLLVVASLRV